MATDGSSTSLDVDLGRQSRVELVLPAGNPVRGLVLGADGAPGAGSLVKLRPHRSRSPGGEERRRTIADSDGVFELSAVPSGVWTVEAEHPDAGSGNAEVFVEDGPVEGLRIELSPGALLRGRILGADLADLASATVQAHSEDGGHGFSRVDWEGRWEAPGVLPGTWHLLATVGGRSVHGTVELAEGEREAVHDFDLGSGFRLEGLVHRDGVGVGGAEVRLGSGVRTVSDPDGWFRFESVPEGWVRVEARAEDGRSARAEIRLEGDERIDLEVSAAAVSGRVVDAATGQGLERAEIRWRSAARPSGGFWPTLSDAEGGFRIEGLPVGPVRLEARSARHSPAEITLDLTDGAERSDVRLELEPSVGVVLQVAAPAPPALEVAILDGARQVRGHDSVPVEPGGAARLGGLPDGRSILHLGAEGRASVEVEVEVPSPGPIPVVLPPACTVIVEAPEPGESPGSARFVRILDAAGSPYRRHGGQDHYPLIRGIVQVDGLAPGPWTVVLGSPEKLDGESRSVVMSPERITRVRFD